MNMRCKVEVNILGKDYGISFGPGRVVEMDEPLDGGHTLRDLIGRQEVLPEWFEVVQDDQHVAQAPMFVHDHPADADEEKSWH